MKYNKRNLSQRILIVAVGYIMSIFICLGIITVIQGTDMGNSKYWMMVIWFWVFLFTLVAFLVVFFWIWLPMKKLRDEDLRFTESENLNTAYYPPYSWSSSNKSVIDRFQMITEHRAVIAQSIEASKYMALQQQINPHFLYNTLDALRCDVLLTGNAEIADTIKALSNYFSYVVSNMDQFANVYEELGNIRDYFHIQEYRFGERIHLRVINNLSEDDMHDLVLPRMTLQPLVENAITHGLELSETNGTVTIDLESTDSNLVIHVVDDGIGMDSKTLSRLNEYLDHPKQVETEFRKKRGGIALSNVNSRIKLLFGRQYGLRVHSMPGAGTDITVFLPRNTREEKT